MQETQLCYENGEFQRDAFLLAIESGRLNRKELQTVLSEKDIRTQFFGSGSLRKESRRYWDDCISRSFTGKCGMKSLIRMVCYIWRK